MYGTFAILLLLIFAVIFWVFRESKHVWLRALVISLFFGFCVIFGSSIDSIMGWAAKDKYVPEIVTIRHITVREPNPETGDPGNIYILIEHPATKNNLFLRAFGYEAKTSEPRLFKIPYNRPLHENLQQNVMGKLAKGQTVTGKLGKGKGKGKGGGKGGDGDGDGDGEGEGRPGRGRPGGRPGSGQGNGGGSDSLEVPWVFHVLPPSAFLRKDTPEN